MSDGQMIYDIGVRLAWKKKKGNGYVNMYLGTKDRPFQFVTRAKDLDAINRNPEMIAKMMGYVGATRKAVYDFYVMLPCRTKEISQSFAHKQEDYEKEFGK